MSKMESWLVGFGEMKLSNCMNKFEYICVVFIYINIGR